MATHLASPHADSRLLVVWAAKYVIVPLAVLLAAGAYLLAGQQPIHYTAQSTVHVTLVGLQDSAEQNVLAQNDLAAEFAQLTTSSPVELAAATSLGISPGQLGVVSASAVNAFNIVGINVQTSSASAAAPRAQALATALVAYVNQHSRQQAKKSAAIVAPQLKELNHQIRSLQTTIASETATLGTDGTSSTTTSPYASVLPGQLSLLSSLTTQRSTIFTAQQRNVIDAQPTLTILNQPTSAAASSQHQVLFGLVAFVIALLGLAEIAVLRNTLRRARGVRP